MASRSGPITVQSGGCPDLGPHEKSHVTRLYCSRIRPERPPDNRALCELVPEIEATRTTARLSRSGGHAVAMTVVLHISQIGGMYVLGLVFAGTSTEARPEMTRFLATTMGLEPTLVEGVEADLFRSRTARTWRWPRQAGWATLRGRSGS